MLQKGIDLVSCRDDREGRHHGRRSEEIRALRPHPVLNQHTDEIQISTEEQCEHKAGTGE